MEETIVGARPSPPERDAEIYIRFVRGERQMRLADEFGVSPARISQIISEQRDRIPAEDRISMVKDSIELQRLVRKQALDIADLPGAPVAVGKDGQILYDPVTKDVVRDYKTQLAALALAAQTDNDLAKRLGLNAPNQVESTSTVHYKLDGVDLEDLK